MKYLKRYNESVSDEVLEICIDHLAFVMDSIKDFKVRVDIDKDGYRSISFYRSEPNHNRFSWDVIKDDFITLVNILNIKYEVVNILVMTNKSTPIKIINKEEPTIDHILSIDDVLEDNIEENVNDIMIIIIKLRK
jgi:hypothetical protein